MSNNSHSSGQLREFRYGRSTIEYQLVIEDRKNLAITVNPDKSVVVKAPLESSLDEIQAKMVKRGQWIVKQLNYFDKFHPLQPERQYVGGETHYYLGRQYRLRIRRGPKNSVKLIGKFFVVRTPEPGNRERIELLMKEWYAIHAQLLLDRRVKIYWERILGSGFRTLEIQYRTMKRRWGSYSQNGTITFNIELVKAPLNCVDYVIVHELCHLVHPNHDKGFYRLVESIMPQWRSNKEKLELFGAR
jgi:predicted metal-dependent hydrolase